MLTVDGTSQGHLPAGGETGHRLSPMTSYGVRKGSPTSGGRFGANILLLRPDLPKDTVITCSLTQNVKESHIWTGGRPVARSVAARARWRQPQYARSLQQVQTVRTHFKNRYTYSCRGKPPRVLANFPSSCSSPVIARGHLGCLLGLLYLQSKLAARSL